jgi:methyladenine glycosylase
MATKRCAWVSTNDVLMLQHHDREWVVPVHDDRKHFEFSGFGAPVNWIAADIVRIQNGILVEHWDVIQDEATEEQSVSKRPMFGTTFPTYA